MSVKYFFFLRVPIKWGFPFWRNATSPRTTVCSDGERISLGKNANDGHGNYIISILGDLIQTLDSQRGSLNQE